MENSSSKILLKDVNTLKNIQDQLILHKIKNKMEKIDLRTEVFATSIDESCRLERNSTTQRALTKLMGWF